MLFRSTQSHSTGIEPGSDRNCSTSRGQGRVSSYVPHPLAADDVERDIYPVLDDFGGQLVALGTRLTSKGADRATLIRDLLNLVPMSDNEPLQFLICDTAQAATTARPASARPRRPCSTRRAFDGDVVEVQLAHDTQK